MNEANERLLIKGLLAALLLSIGGVIALSLCGREVAVMATIATGLAGAFAPSALKNIRTPAAPAPPVFVSANAQSGGDTADAEADKPGGAGG